MSKGRTKKQGTSVSNNQKQGKKRKLQIEFVFPDAPDEMSDEKTATTTGETAKSAKNRARNRIKFRF